MIDWVKKLTGELIDVVEWLDDSTNTLVYRFERHIAHAGPTHLLADRRRVVGIVLVALHVRLHKLRCQ